MKKILFSVFILFAFSCNDDETAPPATAVMTFTSDSSNFTYWILLSDASGKVTAWSKLPKGEKVSLNYEEQNGRDLYTVTIISKSGSHIDLTTFTDVAPDDFHFTDPTYLVPSSTGTYLFNMDYYLFQSLNFDSDNVCGYDYPEDPAKFNYHVCGTSNHLYAWATQSNGIPRYFLTEMKAGGSTTFDQALFDQLPEMKSNPINFSQAITKSGVVVTGNFPNGGEVMVYTNSIYQESTILPLYYPNSPSFSSLDYVLYYSREKDISFAFSNRKPSGLGKNSFDELQVNLDKSTVVNTTSKLHLELTGTAEYGRSILSQYDVPYSRWTVLFPFKNKIDVNLPQFPELLLQEVDLSFVKASHFAQISFQDDDDFEYSSIYSASLKSTDDQIGKNGRTKTYGFGAN